MGTMTAPRSITRTARREEIASLARYRRAQDVRLVDLAARSGYSVPHLSRVLNCKRPISIAEVRALRANIAELAREAIAAANAPKEPRA